jgi:hypothetical protein
MEALDGNAIGGLLQDVFGSDMTTATAVCRHCGAGAIVAECEVYVGGPGAIARCRTCHGLLLVIVEIHDVRCVDMSGVARIESA